MIQPYLSHSSYTYVSVDGLIWLSSGLKLPTNLEEKACDSLIQIFQEINIGQTLVIDFRNIKDVADRALERLFNIFQKSAREAVLINYDAISYKIDKYTTDYYHKDSQNNPQNDGSCCKVLNPIGFKVDGLIESVNNLRNDKVKEFVKSSFTKFEEPRHLNSTPIKATGIFDAAKIITNHTAFYWVSLELSELLKLLLNSGKIALKKELRLLSVNLKSCPFASVVSLLSNIPLVTIDHFGPKHKVYDLDILDGLENLRQYSYIYIGDFCVGGTEIKIAKTYAGISNSHLNTALVIGSFFSDEVFKSSFNLFALVNINGLHPHAKFNM